MPYGAPTFAAAQPRRTRWILLAATVLLGTGGCVPANIRGQYSLLRKDLPPDGEIHSPYYTYYTGLYSFLPDWYRMYSMASGPETPRKQCHRPHLYAFPGQQLSVTIKNCSQASEIQQARLTKLLRKTFASVEKRFHSHVHVAHARFTLYPSKSGYDIHETHIVHPHALTFGMALTYDPGKPSRSERQIVRLAAHELFHLARYILRRTRDASSSDKLSEEQKASFFGLCVDRDVFGSLEKRAFDKGVLFAPQWVKNVRIAHTSADGSIRANQRLNEISANQAKLATAKQVSRFERYCAQIVH